MFLGVQIIPYICAKRSFFNQTACYSIRKDIIEELRVPFIVAPGKQLDSHLPTIALTCDYDTESDYFLFRDYVQSMGKSVNTVMLPFLKKDTARMLLEEKLLHAIVFTGGTRAMNPRYYGNRKIFTDHIYKERDGYEMNLLEQALRADTFVVGICRGHQLLNVFMGGYIKEIEGHKHTLHDVKIAKESKLNSINAPTARWHSNHFFAAKGIPSALKVTAYSRDEAAEAFEYYQSNQLKAISVQCHPERMRFPQFFKLIAEKAYENFQ